MLPYTSACIKGLFLEPIARKICISKSREFIFITAGLCEVTPDIAKTILKNCPTDKRIFVPMMFTTQLAKAGSDVFKDPKFWTDRIDDMAIT